MIEYLEQLRDAGFSISIFGSPVWTKKGQSLVWNVKLVCSPQRRTRWRKKRTITAWGKGESIAGAALLATQHMRNHLVDDNGVFAERLRAALNGVEK